MLHTGLVIDDDIAVSADILVEQGLEHAVDVAVAALALRAAHDEHVEIVLLRQRGFEAVFGIVRLCHALGDRIAAELRLRDLLADLAEGDTGFDAEDLVQIGIGIRVDDEQRTLAALDEGVDHHAADRRFSDAALLIADGDDLHVFCLLFVFIFCSEIVVRQGCAPLPVRRSTGTSPHAAECRIWYNLDGLLRRRKKITWIFWISKCFLRNLFNAASHPI